MSKKIIFLLCGLIVFTKSFCNDSSSYRFTPVLGTCFYGLQKALIDNVGTTGVLFVDEKINKFQFSLGLKIRRKLTPKKEGNFSILYSHANIPYLLQEKNPNNVIISENRGNIALNTLIANLYLNYKVFKFLKFNYGFSSHIKLKNSFDNNIVGQKINWIDNEGKSKMKAINTSLVLGFELKIYKRLSIEYLFHRGFNNYIVLNLEKNNVTNGTIFPQKIRATLLTLNYVI